MNHLENTVRNTIKNKIMTPLLTYEGTCAGHWNPNANFLTSMATELGINVTTQKTDVANLFISVLKMINEKGSAQIFAKTGKFGLLEQ